MTFAILNCILLMIVFLKGLRPGVESTFHFLATMMIIVFFMVPSIWFYSSGEYIYLGHKWDFSVRDFLFVQGCLSAFLVGYLLIDIVFGRHRREAKLDKGEAPSVNQITVYLLFVPVVLLIGAFMVLSDSADLMIAMRRGEIATSPIFALILTTATLFTAAIFFIAAAHRNTILVIIIIPVLVLSASTFGGRMAFAGVIAICIGYFRVPLRPSIFIVMLASPLLIPLAVHGKAIVYAVVGGFEIGEVLTLLTLDVDMHLFVENHLGHPVVSLDNVGSVIDIIGYRYFYDYLQGLVFYLRLFGLPIDGSLTYYNTLILTGEFKSQIPTGFLAFGYVQAEYFGIFVSGIFYRSLGRLAVICYEKIAIDSQLLGFYLALLAANSFYTGEFRTLVLNFFYPLMLLSLIFWVTRFRWMTPHNQRL